MICAARSKQAAWPPAQLPSFRWPLPAVTPGCPVGTEDAKRRLDDHCLCDTPTQSQADRCPRCGLRYAGRTWAEFWRDTAIAAIPWVLLAGVVALAVVGLVALLERLFGA